MAIKPTGTLRRLITYTFVYKRLLLSASILLLLSTVADVLGPILIKIFIDDYLLAENWVAYDLSVLVAVYIVANLAAAFFGYLQSVKLGDIAQRVVYTLRKSIFNHVLVLPIHRFDFTPVGSVVSRITNDTETIKELFVGVLGVYLQNTVKILGIFIAMAFLNIKLMLICALFVPVVIALMLLYRKLSTPVFTRARKLLSDINGSLNETLQGMKVIQLFHQEARFARKFSELNQTYFLTRSKTMQMDALLLRPMVDLLQLVTLAGLLYGFGVSSLESPIEVGVLYAFVNYLGRFIEPLIEMTQRLNLFQQAIVSSERVFKWLDEPKDEALKGADITLGAPKVTFDQVSFGYDQEKRVLKQIDVVINSGEFVGIVGHTGSGKSTLASLLMKFYSPTHGQIRFADQPIDLLPMATLRKQIAIVQQDSFIFQGTLFENVDVGRGIEPESIRQAIQAVGLDTLMNHLAEEEQTLSKENGSNISVGERQMISLARALAGSPSVIILDEATANVDSETERLIQQSLMKLRGKCTVIAIAHRLSTITGADKILVMHQGEIVQQGSHKALMEIDGLYRHMFELQGIAIGTHATGGNLKAPN